MNSLHRQNWILRHIYTHTVLTRCAPFVNYQDASFVSEYVRYTGAASFTSPAGVVSSPALVRDLACLVRDKSLISENISNTQALQDVGYPRKSRAYRLTVPGILTARDLTYTSDPPIKAPMVERILGTKARQLQGSRVYIWTKRPPSSAPHVLVLAHDEASARERAGAALARRSSLPCDHPLCVSSEDVKGWPTEEWDLFVADLHHVMLLQRG